MRIKYLLTLCLVSILGKTANAQAVSMTFNHDPQKYKQVDVIENGGWNFAPDFYYYLYHKKYSGASWHTEWKPWPVPKIKFNETKSDVGRVGPTRVSAALAESEVLKKAKMELDSINPIYKEEMLRAADRNIDLAYQTFKDDFREMQDAISYNLQFILERSKGKLNKAVSAYADVNDLLCARINYIHKTGLGIELENTKREIAYEEIRQDMTDLVKATNRLVYYVAVHYHKE